MHILHITPYMQQGGTENCIINLILHSLENKYRVFLISPPGKSLKKIPEEVEIYRLKNWIATRPLRATSEVKKILLSLREKIDIIQVHAAAEMAYLAGKYLPEKPVIFTCHGYDSPFFSYFNYWLAARFLKKAAYCVVLNPLDMNYFIEAGVKKGKVVFISNGVEEKFFKSPATQNNSSKVVGMVGRLVKQKNISWAIRAQAKYRFASQLLIAGDGPLRGKLEKQVKRLGIDGEVKFLGHREKIENVYPLLSHLLISSRNEACPLAVLEALASGVPVLIPRWLSGLVRFWAATPGVSFFKNAEELKTQIENKKETGEKERIQKFARTFLWENIFKNYKNLYKQALNKGNL